MKFSCEKYLLQQAVAIASRCSASKSPIPALEGLLIEAGQDVRVTGYDLKKGIYTSFPADVAEPGAIVLNTRLFGEIVRSLPDGVVTVTADSVKVKIQCGMSDFDILGTDAEEYPELPSVDRQNAISVPQNVLGKMIRQTIFAVSDNESRPVYTGSLFEVSGDTLTIVAVDGYRLALRKESVEAGDVEDCTFIVPGSALSDVEKLCADTEDKVEITVGAKHISFVVGDTTLVSRRLEGEFLNYKKSVPAEFGLKVEVDRAEILQCVSRASIVIDEKTKNPLRVAMMDNKMSISCFTGIGSALEMCDIKAQGDWSFVIGFNNRYLLDALKAAPADTVMIGMNSSSSPAVIYPADERDDSFAYMILPVRLRAE